MLFLNSDPFQPPLHRGNQRKTPSFSPSLPRHHHHLVSVQGCYFSFPHAEEDEAREKSVPGNTYRRVAHPYSGPSHQHPSHSIPSPGLSDSPCLSADRKSRDKTTNISNVDQRLEFIVIVSRYSPRRAEPRPAVALLPAPSRFCFFCRCRPVFVARLALVCIRSLSLLPALLRRPGLSRVLSHPTSTSDRPTDILPDRMGIIPPVSSKNTSPAPSIRDSFDNPRSCHGSLAALHTLLPRQDAGRFVPACVLPYLFGLDSHTASISATFGCLTLQALDLCTTDRGEKNRLSAPPHLPALNRTKYTPPTPVSGKSDIHTSQASCSASSRLPTLSPGPVLCCRIFSF